MPKAGRTVLILSVAAVGGAGGVVLGYLAGVAAVWCLCGGRLPHGDSIVSGYVVIAFLAAMAAGGVAGAVLWGKLAARGSAGRRPG